MSDFLINSFLINDFLLEYYKERDPIKQCRNVDYEISKHVNTL